MVTLGIGFGVPTIIAATPAEDLLKAVSKGDLKKVQSLLAKGRVDIVAKNTALHSASSDSKDAIVGLLLANGADVNGAAVAFDGTPLISALSGAGQLVIGGQAAGAADVESLDFLQADVYRTIDVLVAGGADVNARTKLGITALGLASNKGLLQAVNKLLAKGADPNAHDSRGITVLMAACLNKNNQPKVVEALIAGGADPNAKNEAGQTALDIATGLGALPIIESLKKAGAK